MPFASVLIDTYNHEKFIERAVTSVLEQDFRASDREVIVVDDGSTDRTREILRKFQPHIRILNKRNGGQASAFNAGIPGAAGEIVAFLDGDDWWAQGKLQKIAEAFSADLGEPWHLDSQGLRQSPCLRKPRLQMSTVQIGRGRCRDAIAR